MRGLDKRQAQNTTTWARLPAVCPLPEHLLAPTIGAMPPPHRHADTPVSPPVQTAAALLPFSLLSWEKFEELCLELLRSQPEVETAKQYGCPGQAQHGIDLYARKRNG